MYNSTGGAGRLGKREGRSYERLPKGGGAEVASEGRSFLLPREKREEPDRVVGVCGVGLWN